MAELDPQSTQRDMDPGIEAELESAGFEDAREIGRGGFGVVYRCVQPSLDRVVAIKVLSSEFEGVDRERFLREQHAMGRLSGHPNIVHILHVGITPMGRPYIVMPYHVRGSLDSRIRRKGPLGWREALRIGVKLAGALETAHRLGIFHRDVKPANILTTDYGDPQLTDFGIARISGGFETAAGSITGSPAFTAPELLRGEDPTAASDVYGLGATLFCAITGHAAFERRNGEKVVSQFLRITSHPIPDLRAQGIPDDVCAAIERAMAGEPTDRPASAADFAHELREVERRHELSVDEMALPGEEGSADGPPENMTAASSRGRLEPRRNPVTPRPPPVASTRFHPPEATRARVERGRLIQVLRAGQGRRLIVIHAPAGFGKSTLAAQWRDALVEENVAVAWFAVDRDDNNVVWFLAHLIEAIRRVRPTLADELGQILEERGDDAERYVLTSLINEIHDSGERMAVVIDDWHMVTGEVTIAAMDFLLDNCCHHLQVIVTTRSQAGLPLSRMRVRDELVEIDAEALRFSVEESRSFLVDIGELTLADNDVADLRESTEGWVAALQLASLSLRGQADPVRLISHMSGRHHAIGEYLAENVLDNLEPEMLDFLLATCITERTCGALASTLSRGDRGQVLLEEVEKRDLFLHRIDDNGDWFRYHHLFAEFLRRRLERDQPDRVAELHQSASRWFAEHRLLSEAVDHALFAGDQDRAVSLVETDGMDLIERSQMATLLGLTAKLPPRLVVSSPRLQLTMAWANFLLRRTAPTQTALALVDSALDQSNRSETDVADLRAEAAVVRSSVEVSADRIDGVDQLVSDCLARPDRLRPWVVSVAVNVATFDKIYRFDFDAADRLQDWASRYPRRANGPFGGVIYGYCIAGIAANERLDVAAAEQHYREALQLGRRSGGSHSNDARLAGALLGDLLYEQGKLAEAERLLDASCELGPEGGVVDFMLATYGTGARIKALRGDLESASRRLDEGASIADALSLPRLRARIRNERVRLGLPTTPGVSTRPLPAEGQIRGDQRDTLGVDGILAIAAELDEQTAIWLMLDERTRERVDRACAEAEALVGRLRGQVRPRALLQARLLLASCLAEAGRTTEAENILAPAAAKCAELGLLRYLLDGGPRIAPALAALREDQRNNRWQPEWPPIPHSFLDEVLTDFGDSPSSAVRRQ